MAKKAKRTAKATAAAKAKRTVKAKATAKARRTVKAKTGVKRGGAKPAIRAALLEGAPAAFAAAAPTPQQMQHARAVVAAVFNERFGATNVPDKTPLSKFGLNGVNLAGIAANIRQHGINVQNAPVQACGGKNYGCVVSATAPAA